MPDPRTFEAVMTEAEQAAQSGDAARAEARLREALRLQHAALGPTHPDLASTLNNLAVVCEANGKLDDAEAFYRRAYAVASASRPAGDPLVVTSRANLHDFCAARNRSFEDWPGIGEPEPVTDRIAAAQARITAATAPRGTPVAPRPAAVATAAPPRPPRPAPWAAAATPVAVDGAGVAPAPDEPVLQHSAPPPQPPARRSWGLPATAAVVGLGIVASVLIRSGDDRTTSSAAPVASPPAADTASHPLAAPEPAATPGRDATAAPAAAALPSSPPAPVPAPVTAVAVDEVRVVAATVCASLTPGGAWSCTPIATPAVPGSASYFTRIASPRPLRVEHRWFQDGELRRRLALTVGANPGEGYRTYSRQQLTPGRWRVEVRALDGAVLHETAFDVQ